MPKRPPCLIAVMLVVSVLSAAVGHACSDVSAMKAVAKTPCDHHQPQDEPLNKTDEDNCDSIRYGMLSTQSSRFQTEVLKQYSIPLDLALCANGLFPHTFQLLSRSQGSFLFGLGASPRLSRVEIRI